MPALAASLTKTREKPARTDTWCRRLGSAGLMVSKPNKFSKSEEKIAVGHDAQKVDFR